MSALSYGISVFDYLNRARQQLDEKTNQSLFYAAFELRCAIEKLVFMRLEAIYGDWKKIKDWHADKLFSKLIEMDEEAKALWTLVLSSDEKSSAFRYIPIPEKLVKEDYGKLGNLSHAQKEGRYDFYPWWNEQRAFLEIIYAEVKDIACGSDLLKPPKFRIVEL